MIQGYWWIDKGFIWRDVVEACKWRSNTSEEFGAHSFGRTDNLPSNRFSLYEQPARLASDLLINAEFISCLMKEAYYWQDLVEA